MEVLVEAEEGEQREVEGLAPTVRALCWFAPIRADQGVLSATPVERACRGVSPVRPYGLDPCWCRGPRVYRSTVGETGQSPLVPPGK